MALLGESDLRRIRRVLIDMHYRNRVGHLGGNLSCLDAMLYLHHELMQPGDRFVLSKGHSAGAYYVTLWSIGRLEETELATFHQDATRLAGHPPANCIAEIAFATGSLGHGLSLAAGLAKAAKLKRRPHRVFCLTSDGEWQEGSTMEALAFAVHHKLDNLTVLVDHNGLQGFGTTTDISSMSPLDEKLECLVADQRTCDGHSLEALRQTVAPRGRHGPTVVIMKTRKGRGVPEFEGRMESHYLPLTETQYDLAMEALKGAP
jgi:transketolase